MEFLQTRVLVRLLGRVSCEASSLSAADASRVCTAVIRTSLGARRARREGRQCVNLPQCHALALFERAVLIHRLFAVPRLPEVEACDDVVAQLVFICVQNLKSLVLCPPSNVELCEHTSLVEVWSHLMFFAVTICTKPPLSMCRISMKLGSKARM